MLQRLKFFPHWFRLVAWILLSGVLLIRVAAAAPNTALPASRCGRNRDTQPPDGVGRTDQYRHSYLRSDVERRGGMLGGQHFRAAR